MNTTALVLFSWWLDSLLTIKILERQGVDVTALTYETPFFKATKARALAQHYWFKHIVRDISDPHFDIVKNPKYWYWKNMNPCIDCHWFMFMVAKQIANEMWIQIIASWEVFWQRPFSQNKQALTKVRLLAWCEVLMPLSAKLLEATSYETEWLISRAMLYDIKWKTRKVQLELIKEYNIDKYSTPWGWCILTTKEYSDKLRSFIEEFEDKVKAIDSEVIKHWRCKVFIIWDKKYFWVMWRRQSDNDILSELFLKLDDNYKLINFVDIAWPRVILLNFWQETSEQLIKDLVKWMQEKVVVAKDLKEIKVKVQGGGKEKERIIKLS